MVASPSSEQRILLFPLYHTCSHHGQPCSEQRILIANPSSEQPIQFFPLSHTLSHHGQPCSEQRILIANPSSEQRILSFCLCNSCLHHNFCPVTVKRLEPDERRYTKNKKKAQNLSINQKASPSSRL